MSLYTTYLGFLRRHGYRNGQANSMVIDGKKTEFVYIMRSRGNRAVEPPEMVLRLAKEGVITWEGYRDAYLDSLNCQDSRVWMELVAQRLAEKNIVLVCYEGPRFGTRCHRFLLAQILQKDYGAEYRGELKP